MAQTQFRTPGNCGDHKPKLARLDGMNIGVGPQFRFPTTWFWLIAWLVGTVVWLMMDWNSISRLLGL